jgi:hypothetical protein
MRRQKSETHLEILSDFANKTLEGELADEEFGGLLVATDFAERDRSRPETMGLLDTASGLLGSLASGALGGELSKDESVLRWSVHSRQRRRTCLRGALPPVD